MIQDKGLLVSNTAICEASRFCLGNFEAHTICLTDDFDLKRRRKVGPFYGRRIESVRVKRLLDFQCIVQSVVLSEKIYTLPAQLPSDSSSSQLYKALTSQGILVPLRLHALPSTVLDEVITWIQSASKDRRAKPERQMEDSEVIAILRQCLGLPFKTAPKLGRGYAGSFRRRINRFLPHFIDDYYATASWWVDQFHAEDDAEGRFGRTMANLAAHVGSLIAYAGSGAYESGVCLLRTLCYLSTAKNTHIPMFPDAARLPIVWAVNKNIHASLALEAYTHLAKLFRTTAERLLELDAPIEIPFPPLTGIVLSRCARPDDLIPEMLQLRGEMAPFRRKLSDLEQELRDPSATLGGMVKSARRITSIWRGWRPRLARRLQMRKTWMDRASYVLPDAMNTLVGASQPRALAAQLGHLGIDKLRDWWVSRPLNPLLHVLDELEAMEGYKDALSRLFNWQVSREEVQDYSSCFCDHLSFFGMVEEEDEE